MWTAQLFDLGEIDIFIRDKTQAGLINAIHKNPDARVEAVLIRAVIADAANADIRLFIVARRIGQSRQLQFQLLKGRNILLLDFVGAHRGDGDGNVLQFFLHFSRDDRDRLDLHILAPGSAAPAGLLGRGRRRLRRGSGGLRRTGRRRLLRENASTGCEQNRDESS